MSAVTDQSLQISFDKTDSSSAGKRWVHLTQPVESGMDKTASMHDISQMIALAKGGRSAHTFKKNSCPATVTDTGVNVRLDFEAWPSSPTLAYTLEVNIGAVSLPIIIEEYTEFSIIFGKTDSVELDFILESISEYSWETPCYSVRGEILPDQDLSMDGYSTIRTPIAVFGVVRVKGRKIGARHRVTHKLITSYPTRPDEPIPEDELTQEVIDEYWAYTDVATWNGELVNPDDYVNLSGLSITNLSISITARWFNAEGDEETETMNLTVPQCIQDLLSNCNGNLDDFNGGDGTTNICHSGNLPNPLNVYFSICSGNVITTRRASDDSDSWCG